MSYMTVDRIESDYAVMLLDDGSTFNMEISALPSGAAEGSVLGFDENGNLCIDREEQKKRRNRNIELTKKLFKK